MERRLNDEPRIITKLKKRRFSDRKTHSPKPRTKIDGYPIGCPAQYGKATCHPCGGGWPGTQMQSDEFIRAVRNKQLNINKVGCGMLREQVIFLQNKFGQPIEQANPQPNPEISTYLAENHFTFDRWINTIVRRHYIASGPEVNDSGIVHIYTEAFPQFGPLLLSTRKGLLNNIGRTVFGKLGFSKQEIVDQLEYRQFHIPSPQNLQLLESAIFSLNHHQTLTNNGKSSLPGLDKKVPFAVLKNTYSDAAYFVASSAVVLTNGKPTLVVTPQDEQFVEIASLPELIKRSLN